MTPDAVRGPDDPIAAIRARHERNSRPHPADDKWEGTWEWQMHADIATLLGALGEIETAARKLIAELSDVQIEAVREGCGHTNAAVLALRRDELVDALATAGGGAGREGEKAT